jgi:Protein of unknown function DUF262
LLIYGTNAIDYWKSILKCGVVSAGPCLVRHRNFRRPGLRTKKPIYLDAMIARADFAEIASNTSEAPKIPGVSLNNLGVDSFLVPVLRKPDFQRETNQWTEDQVLIFLKSFLDNELVPAVIFWRSPDKIFVIDGAHRVSALLAWVNDDYGDGHKSQVLFGNNISTEQRASAERLRRLINKEIGSYSSFSSWMRLQDLSSLSMEQQARVGNARIRSIDLQWVEGTAEKAESSFFKINKQGTPLDPTEERLLRNRRAPISIASRAIIRAGTGHKYWSKFNPESVESIEALSREIYELLFAPELSNPVKTLNLPHGGHTSPISAYNLLMDVITQAVGGDGSDDVKSKLYDIDIDGSLTYDALNRTKVVMARITGNDISSLGLHPAVYFYSPGGRHWDVMFLATIRVFSKAIRNNDKPFFRTFAENRAILEKILIEHKALLGQINIAIRSKVRIEKWANFIEDAARGKILKQSQTQSDILHALDVAGKIIVSEFSDSGPDISDETKSEAFFRTAFAAAVKAFRFQVGSYPAAWK